MASIMSPTVLWDPRSKQQQQQDAEAASMEQMQRSINQRNQLEQLSQEMLGHSPAAARAQYEADAAVQSQAEAAYARDQVLFGTKGADLTNLHSLELRMKRLQPPTGSPGGGGGMRGPGDSPGSRGYHGYGRPSLMGPAPDDGRRIGRKPVERAGPGGLDEHYANQVRDPLTGQRKYDPFSDGLDGQGFEKNPRKTSAQAADDLRAMDMTTGFGGRGVRRLYDGGEFDPYELLMVGDKPPSLGDLVASPFAAAQVPRPEIMVTADGARPVGLMGPELIRPDKPGVILPNPRTVVELGLGPEPMRARPPAMYRDNSGQMVPLEQLLGKGPGPMPAKVSVGGVDFDPNAGPSDAQWTFLRAQEKQAMARQGQGDSFDPTAPQQDVFSAAAAAAEAQGRPPGMDARQWDQYQRSPDGRKAAITSAAGRSDLMFQRGLTAKDNASTAEAKKAEKEAELKRKDQISKEKLKAMAGATSILLPTDEEALYQISDPDAREAAMNDVIKYRLEEREKAAAAAGPKEWKRPVPGQPGKFMYGVGNNVMGQYDQAGNKQPMTPQQAKERGLVAEGYDLYGQATGWVNPQPQVTRALDPNTGKTLDLLPGEHVPDGWQSLSAQPGQGAGSGPVGQSKSANRFSSVLGAAPSPTAQPVAAGSGVLLPAAPAAPAAPVAAAASPAYVPKGEQRRQSDEQTKQQQLNQAWTKAKSNAAIGIDPALLKLAVQNKGKVNTGLTGGQTTVARALLTDLGLDPNAAVEIDGRSVTRAGLLDLYLQELRNAQR